MTEKVSTRQAYGEALLKYGVNPLVTVLDSDVSTCTMSCIFGEKYPDRFYNVGIAEANMVGIAAGMATMGLIPFVHTFAMFMAGRAYDQIRNSICYPRLNVRCVGTHAGLTVGEDGATHQCIEDIALMRAIPGMTVICPSDGIETDAAVSSLISYNGPVYLRLGRLAVDLVNNYEGYSFEIGKAQQIMDGTDVTIIATGIMVNTALKAAEHLLSIGVNARVLNMHTIKPLDESAVIQAAKETGCIVTAEEHNVIGGLGGAVAEVVSEHLPVPVIKVGIQDVFGRSGNAQELMKLYHLTSDDVIVAAKKALNMKGLMHKTHS